MSFIASKLFWWAVNPGNVLLALLCLGLVALLAGRRRLGVWLIGFVTVLGLAVTVLPLGAWILRPLENRFPAVDVPDRLDGIIVLGGAINPGLSVARGQPVLTDSAERLFAFVALARRHPEARLVFTGGSASVVDTIDREADIAGAVFDSLGLERDRVAFERDSRNTYENALFSKRAVEPKPGERWLLITSAYHMPRAVGCFRAQGWPVIAYPVDYGTSPESDPPSLSLLAGLDGVHWALREWIGLVFYYLAGRTPELLPSPR
ncbi:MAG: YdcF family protein [Proteobacteria bacterium]|nr:YdcF family protein [Pseudomonadota bacterium]